MCVLFFLNLQRINKTHEQNDTVMIKGKGKMSKMCGQLFDEELRKACSKLPDNAEYEFLIVNQKKNRNLPYTQYLFSVV